MLSTHGLPLTGTAKNRSFVDARRARHWIEGVTLWLAVLLFLFVHPVYARATDGAGAFHFISDQGQRQLPATLVSTDYHIEVSGLIADTRLRQSFQNTSAQWQEGVYTFPLPENASLYKLVMTAGEQLVIGEVRERHEAKQQYEQARQEGRRAVRMVQQRPNLFTTHLANIPPEETVTVEVHYQQLVRYQSGEFELRLPTTLTPRYMPGTPLAGGEAKWQGGWALPTDQVKDAHRISPFTVRPADLDPASHQATVELSLSMGIPVGSVSSPSHRVQTTWQGDRVLVEPESGTVLMDRDLVVRWQPVRDQAPSAAVFREHWQGQDYLLALLVPGIGREDRLPREVVFVVDTSGSMAGNSIRQARESLLRGLDTLAPDDRFNIIQFNSETHSLFMQAEPANGNNRLRARRYVGKLDANGGTEVAPALDAALRGGHSDAEGFIRQVVFITDGAVGNESALFAKIRRQLGSSRLFTVGIGSAPNMHFMRNAARYGRGTYTAISDLDNVSGPLDDLLAKMQSPVLADIQVTWPPGYAGGALPGRPGDLFQGEPLIQVAHGKGTGGHVKVSGQLPGGARWQQVLALDRAAAGKGLHRYWAREKIDSLEDRALGGPVESETRKAITGLALKHQLVTRYTSFVATDKTPVRADNELLATDKLPTLLPAGSTATMLRYPQTATVSPLLVAVGLLGLMLSVAMLMLQGRVFS